VSAKDTPHAGAPRKLSRAEIALVGVLVIVSCVAGFLPLFNVLRGYLILTIHNVYLLSAHAGAVPVYLAMRPRRRGLVSFLIAAAVLCPPVAYFVAHSGPIVYFGNLAGTPDAIRTIAGASGLAAIFCLVIASVWEQKNKRALARHGLLAVFVMWVSVLVSRLLMLRISDSLPMTFDRHLYAFDAGFGGQLSFAAGRLFDRLPILHSVCLLIYCALPFAVLFLFANLRATARTRWLLLAHFTLIGIVGRFCYSAVPAMGPIYQFPAQFPGNAPAVASLTMELVHLPPGARNAMPSLHAAWVLMLSWWTYRQRRWVRVAAGLFLFLTLLATLGLGEHYLIDLIVAVPVALASCAVITPLLPGNRMPWVALGVGLGLSIFWFVLFRSPMLSIASRPQIVWPLSVATLSLSLLVAPWDTLQTRD
jgi:hypothetical protein